MSNDKTCSFVLSGGPKEGRCDWDTLIIQRRTKNKILIYLTEISNSRHCLNDFLSNSVPFYTLQMYVHNYNSHEQQHHIVGDRFQLFI
jgi:hypothetical protein